MNKEIGGQGFSDMEGTKESPPVMEKGGIFSDQETAEAAVQTMKENLGRMFHEGHQRQALNHARAADSLYEEWRDLSPEYSATLPPEQRLQVLREAADKHTAKIRNRFNGKEES